MVQLMVKLCRTSSKSSIIVNGFKWFLSNLEGTSKAFQRVKNGIRQIGKFVIADQILAIGPTLADAYQQFFHSRDIDQSVLIYTPSIFSEIWEVPLLDVVEVKELSVFLVLLFGLSGKFEIKGWEIAAKANSALDDETHTLMSVYPPCSGKNRSH